MRRGLIAAWVLLVGCCGGCQLGGGPARPLVGLTSVYKVNTGSGKASASVNFAYVNAVVEAGGTPVVLPSIEDEAVIEQYVRRLDALVLVGGADVPPAAYGQRPHETVRELPRQRYEFERTLIAHWLDSGKPLLGVCLGMQFTNVVAGGTLIQDIPSQIGRQIDHRGYHEVRIEPGSMLAGILGKDHVRVYSNHHQAVKGLGPGLKVAASSADGVIEALERTDGGFGLFVQWHPESTDDLPSRRAIYGALVAACKKR